ncbi:S1C family serine protease, partial [Gemmatimonadota bacterium]
MDLSSIRATASAAACGIFLCVSLLLLGTAELKSQEKRLSVAEIAERAIPATVTILNYDQRDSLAAFGSGVILSEDGLIVTNWHVLQGASSAQVMLSTDERFDRITVLDGDSIADLVILKIQGAGLPVLPTTIETPRIGTPLVVVGNPYGLNQTVSDGILGGTRLYEGKELLQITAPISPGSSGGPVLDDFGRVVGMTRSTLNPEVFPDAQNLNFAVHIRYAMGMLSESSEPREVWEVFAPPEERERRREELRAEAAEEAARIRRAEEQAAAEVRRQERARAAEEARRLRETEERQQAEEQRIADSVQAEGRRFADSLRAAEIRKRTSSGFSIRGGIAKPTYPE